MWYGRLGHVWISVEMILKVGSRVKSLRDYVWLSPKIMFETKILSEN